MCLVILTLAPNGQTPLAIPLRFRFPDLPTASNFANANAHRGAIIIDDCEQVQESGHLKYLKDLYRRLSKKPATTLEVYNENTRKWAGITARVANPKTDENRNTSQFYWRYGIERRPPFFDELEYFPFPQGVNELNLFLAGETVGGRFKIINAFVASQEYVEKRMLSEGGGAGKWSVAENLNNSHNLKGKSLAAFQFMKADLTSKEAWRSMLNFEAPLALTLEGLIAVGCDNTCEGRQVHICDYCRAAASFTLETDEGEVEHRWCSTGGKAGHAVLLSEFGKNSRTGALHTRCSTCHAKHAKSSHEKRSKRKETKETEWNRQAEKKKNKSL